MGASITSYPFVFVCLSGVVDRCGWHSPRDVTLFPKQSQVWEPSGHPDRVYDTEPSEVDLEGLAKTAELEKQNNRKATTGRAEAGWWLENAGGGLWRRRMDRRARLIQRPRSARSAASDARRPASQELAGWRQRSPPPPHRHPPTPQGPELLGTKSPCAARRFQSDHTASGPRRPGGGAAVAFVQKAEAAQKSIRPPGTGHCLLSDKCPPATQASSGKWAQHVKQRSPAKHRAPSCSPPRDVLSSIARPRFLTERRGGQAGRERGASPRAGLRGRGRNRRLQGEGLS